MYNKKEDLYLLIKDKNGCQHPKPCIFMDRDGVIIEDTHFVSNPEEVVLCKGAKSFLEKQRMLDNKVVVVTNQSGIGRNIFTWREYDNVTNKMLELLGSQAKINAIYANSLTPKEFTDLCSWRKPGIGMLLAAKQDLNIDMEKSVFIGDRITDMLAGWISGVERLIMITKRTVHDIESELDQTISQAVKNGNSILAAKIMSKIEIYNCLSKVIISGKQVCKDK